VRSDYGYDALNRLTSLVVRHADDDKLLEQTFMLHANGQRDYVIEKRYDGTGGTPTSKVKIDWTYDALNRLVTETRDADLTPGDGSDDFGICEGDDYTDAFAFDLAGNRISRKRGWDADADGKLESGEPLDETIAYVYNDRDQLMSEGPDANGDGSPETATDTMYTYDANGSTATITAADGSTKRYVWDLRNRMVGIDGNNDNDLNDAVDTSYGYDEAGQRVTQRTGSGDVTFFVNDKNNPNGYPQILEQKVGTAISTAVLDRSYVLGLRVEGQYDSVDGALYFVRDGHGSNRLLTDGAGDAMELYDYRAFGEAVGFNAIEAQTIHLFGGDGELDEASGWYYHDARWRDSGRFVSFDPFEMDSERVQKQHKYRYASANPISNLDPSGNFDFSQISQLVHSAVSMLIAGLKGVMVRGAFLYARTITAAGSFAYWVRDRLSIIANYFPRAATSSQRLLTTTHQLQKKFQKHAADFGVMGNWNPANATKFSAALNQHINSPGVRTIQGELRGFTEPVIHIVDRVTRLNVTTTVSGEFITGWRLSAMQLHHVLTTGKLGGG
jgi:RHS repeat-associated protein